MSSSEQSYIDRWIASMVNKYQYQSNIDEHIVLTRKCQSEKNGMLTFISIEQLKHIQAIDQFHAIGQIITIESVIPNA